MGLSVYYVDAPVVLSTGLMIYDSLNKACGVITNWTKLKNFFVGKTFYKDTVCNSRGGIIQYHSTWRWKKYGHDISATKTFYQQTISQKATFNILIPISQNEIYEPRDL